jgi:DNA-binding transcriptional MerR regulator
LKPQKNRAGNRIYTNKDISLILHIKMLLREKKYTIEGAKKILEDYSPDQETIIADQSSAEKEENYTEIKKEKPSLKKDLEEIKSILEFVLEKL